MRRFFVGVPLLLLLLWGMGGVVFAHANLVHSIPEAGATLQAAPAVVQMEFGENLDPGFSSARLLNSQGQPIATDPALFDPSTPKIMRLTLPTLQQGAYTVLWNARSASDGHVTEGSVPFGVGVPAPELGLIPAPGTPDPATALPPVAEQSMRWVGLVAVALALGSIAFGGLIWLPATPTTPEAWPTADHTMLQLIQRITQLGAVGLLLGTLGLLLVQAAHAAGVGFAEAFAPTIKLLSGSTGWFWIARLLLTLILFGVSTRLSFSVRWLWLVGLGVAVLLLATFSFGSHAASDPLLFMADLVHRLAMVLWLGGLLPLLFVVRLAQQAGVPTLLSRLVPRFSRLAIGSVVALTISGTYAAYIHIGTLDLMTATTYGEALAIKIGLFGLLLLLGAINLLWATPRLATGQSIKPLQRSIGLELLLGAGVLLAAAAMTSVAPAKVAWEAHERQGITTAAQTNGVDFKLQVAPMAVGENQFAVNITDQRPGAATAASKVIFRFTMQGMQMGEVTTDAKPTNQPDHYTAQGSFLSMAGRWQMTVILRRAGFDDVQQLFTLDVTHPVNQ